MAVVKSHIAEFLRDVNKLLDDKLDAAAEIVFDEVHRLHDEPKHGVDYRRPGKRGKLKSSKRIKRQSSAPGEAPAVQSRKLYRNLTVQKFKKSRRIGFPDPKILWLERGTRSIKPRPSLIPAYNNVKPAIRRLFGVRA